MRATALAVLLSTVALPAFAANITAFSQTTSSNTVTATTNAGDTQTTLTIDDAVISIGQFVVAAPATAYYNLDATSVNAASTFSGAVIQNYSGSFCITSASNCGGTNLLSGVFSDAAFGALGGPGLVVNVNNPPDTLTLTSDIIPSNQLAAPSSLGLTFTNLSPLLHIEGTTIGDFTAAFAGTVSASTTDIPVPEPTTLGILGLGLLGLGMTQLKRR